MGFIIKLSSDHYMSFNVLHVCLPIRIKSKADNNNAIPTGIVTVDNFLHWLKEIHIKRYDDDFQIFPVSNST